MATPFKATTTYTADSVARRFGITVDQLQALNPGHNIRAGIVKGATISVPSVYGNAEDAAPAASGTPGVTTPATTTSAAAAIQTQNAADALTSIFNSYGLGTLSPEIIKLAQEGLGADSIALKLQETDAYKQRFKANAARIKAGMNALSPAEYIATERAYRQVMSNAGLPIGFYDQQDDFEKFLEMDVSPSELQTRVDSATEAINQAPKETLDFAKQWYGIGDLVAYALDPEKASTLIQKQIKAAEAAALARRNGTGLGQDLAEQIGSQGLSYGQMQQGFGEVGKDAPTAAKLSAIYGADVTADDLVKEVFLNDATATNKVKGLASQERAAFSGTSGVGRGSFGTDGGQI